MEKRRAHVPKGLPIAAGILLVLGLISIPLIQQVATPEQLARNVLLNGIPFILIFVAIILAYISVIWLVASALNDQIDPRLQRNIERIIIAGILIGIVGMFQPWVMGLYTWGFVLLLLSTLSYILWSHVRPRATATEQAGGVSASEVVSP
jgi:hypothetical protein